MPAQRAWFHRLDEILETLRGMESTHLDRLTVWEDHLCSERSTGANRCIFSTVTKEDSL
jgi:hypothetical protein